MRNLAQPARQPDMATGVERKGLVPGIGARKCPGVGPRASRAERRAKLVTDDGVVVAADVRVVTYVGVVVSAAVRVVVAIVVVVVVVDVGVELVVGVAVAVVVVVVVAAVVG